ncbi:MAG: threonylcarbamoyl-AMP synthase [Candidatus Sungbacteria bacterium]|uniref:L-threonylcarbamoyladenylate synthase n=1 Tax=Candidatus Sungiibacteriota bacterium TaxID=2750080 RepID=A0A932YWV1_9BACT|nr:threonylcarbamoyl-AMP synthase [Parcubacteria group bacterium]MBI4132932.1 threonylcarbamoyl-AMP synthase [Candidatus Sungbacteria bacterium]
MTGAVSALKSGGVIVYPTDTAYAIGCDAMNESAVKKIFEMKGREQSKTLPLIAADTDMVRTWAEMPEKAEELAQQHWPGPLTLVLPAKKQGLAPPTVKDGWVAIRVPDNMIATDLSREAGVPIVATSANASGSGPYYSIADVRASLGPASEPVDCYVDGGVLPNKRVSTIVKVWDTNHIEIIREGAVKL